MIKFIALLATGILLATPTFAQTNSPTDVTKPTISGVTVSGVSPTGATVTWTTNEAATSYVDFGPSDVYGNTLGDGQYLTTHSVTLLGMAPSTQYHFRVRSKDAAGNEATSTDTTLTTLALTNTNAPVNGNTNSVVNTNTVKNTNSLTNTNTTNKNVNTNKNTNVRANANLNTNKTANVNSTNSTVSIFNQNTNAGTPDTTNLNVSTVSNTNTTATPASGDGRTGIFLIVLGLLVLVGVIGFAWYKLRQPKGPQV